MSQSNIAAATRTINAHAGWRSMNRAISVRVPSVSRDRL
jgi:hypothetical protein